MYTEIREDYFRDVLFFAASVVSATSTKISLPSTILLFMEFNALRASASDSKVTNPKPLGLWVLGSLTSLAAHPINKSISINQINLALIPS